MTTSGWNSTANGAVTRRVTTGSVTTFLSLTASSGLALRTSGCDPSASVSRPERPQLARRRGCATCSALTTRPNDWLTAAAISS